MTANAGLRAGLPVPRFRMLIYRAGRGAESRACPTRLSPAIGGFKQSGVGSETKIYGIEE
jgi:hypothetical protein